MNDNVYQRTDGLDFITCSTDGNRLDDEGICLEKNVCSGYPEGCPKLEDSKEDYLYLIGGDARKCKFC